MKAITTYLFLALIITSCTHPQKRHQDADKSIFIEENIEGLEAGNKIFSKIEFLPMEESDNFLIGGVSKISIIDSLCYILDKNKSKALYLYNNKGMALSKFQKIGGAGDEYIEVVDFHVDKEEKEVSIYCFPPKLIITDLSLKKIKETISLERIIADRMIKWNNLYYFYKHNERTVLSYDVTLNQEKIILKTAEMKSDLINKSPVFFSVSENLFFQSPGDECIYTLEGTEFKPDIVLNYKNKSKSVDFYQTHENADISFNERNQNPLPYVWCMFERNNGISFFYTFNFLVRMCTYDGERYIDQFIRFFPTTNSMIYNNNCLYSCDFIENMDIVNLPEFYSFMKGVDINYSEFKKNNSFENPILVKYYLK